MPAGNKGLAKKGQNRTFDAVLILTFGNLLNIYTSNSPFFPQITDQKTYIL